MRFILVILAATVAMAEDMTDSAKLPAKEGHYNTPSEAQAVLDAVRSSYKAFYHADLPNVTMNYHFGCNQRSDLATFIASVKDEGFDQLDPSYIDDNGSDEKHLPRYGWVAGKSLPYDGQMLLDEFLKYQRIAEMAHIDFGGITPDDRQGE